MQDAIIKKTKKKQIQKKRIQIITNKSNSKTKRGKGAWAVTKVIITE